MAHDSAGYAYLAELGDVRALDPDVVCQVRAVKRVERIGDLIAIPAALKPADGDILGHILFALKYEGVNLQILAQALPLVAEPVIREAFNSSPNGKYLRIACFLWEHFNRETIRRSLEELKGNYQPLFDPHIYIAPTVGFRDRRWRINCNPLGTLGYCATVRRTERLETALQKNVLKRAWAFTESLDPDLLNRTLSWAYLSETRDSFAIEKETPDTGKTQRFVNLLRKAHENRIIDEDYLVELQNDTINNKFDWAASFRTEQNHLSNGAGAFGVTYVPPEPELCRELMEHWMQLANHPWKDVDALVQSAIISFGFVFLHPFMDGNGRLSRFMFHQSLCRQGCLDNGLILPVSAVLKDRERDYLDALTSYSAGTRTYWDVDYIDPDHVICTFVGHDSIYRYWDGTRCAELMLEACEEAVEQHLKREVAYLARFDALKRRIDREYDIADKTLSQLVMFCLDQKGRISRKRRSQYQHRVPEGALEAIEEAYRELFEEERPDPQPDT